MFSNVEQRVARKAADALPDRVHNSALANTVLAPVLANRAPWLITPYLGLRARLSQVWINRWTVLLILCLVRTLIAMTSMHDGINSARREALSACSGVEQAGSALASMPHYMSTGVNELTAHGIDRAINGLMSMLIMSVTGIEEIVVFVINLLTSTYVCLITLVVGGALHAGLALIEDATKFLNQTLGDIGNDLQGAVDGFEKGLNGVVGGLNDSGNLFGGNDDIPKLNIDDQIDALHNLKLPSDLTDELNKLNASIPNFAEVNAFTNSVVRLPFEEIKKLMRENLPHYSFDRNLFPVPAKERLSFCKDDNGIDSFFDDLINLVFEARKIAVAVLVSLALAVMLPMAYREIRRYRTMNERAEMMDAGHDPMDLVYLASRPSSSGVGLKAAKRFQTSRKQALVRWAIAYATTVPALFVLSLGVAGLFSCLCRYITLQAVTKDVPHLVQQVDGFSDKVVFALNNASMSWANGTNTMILDKNAQINADVFGWVNTSTQALNDTLNTFVDKTIDVLNTTFGGTVLYDPVTELFNCLIGLKIAGIEKGLTWIHDNAHVDFPLLPADTFSLGAAAKLADDSSNGGGEGGSNDAEDFMANPGGDAYGAVSGAVYTLIEHAYQSIRTEALISTAVVGVWILIALIGIIRALTLFYGNDDTYPDSARSSASFATGHGVTPRAREPTLPAVDENGIMSEKAAIAKAMGEKEQEAFNPFADPRTPPTPTGPRFSMLTQPPAVAVHPPTGPSSPTNMHGNNYRGAPYTINPRPFPNFRASVSRPDPDDEAPISPIGGPAEAKPGHVNNQEFGLAVRRPTTQRQSSNGVIERVPPPPAYGTPGQGHDRSAFAGLGS